MMDQELKISSILKQLHVSHLSLQNRLLSIHNDAQFINHIHSKISKDTNRSFIVIPNERCGSWYIDPEIKAEKSVYFKSTDGHTTQWSFSTRRLNLQLLDILEESMRNEKVGGVMIVDSTRRGKLMPDSMSKTIGIWCAVMNYMMFGDDDIESLKNRFKDDSFKDELEEAVANNWFFYPPEMVSKNEASSIIPLIPRFKEDLESLRILSKEKLLTKFKGRYLRPLWVYQQPTGRAGNYPFRQSPPEIDLGEMDSSNFIPIINCIASIKAQDGQLKLQRKDTYGIITGDMYTYVQGAADDHELWSRGLTPELYWENIGILLDVALSERELEELVDEIVGHDKRRIQKHDMSVDSISDVVEMTDVLSVGKATGNLNRSSTNGYTVVILLSSDYKFVQDSSVEKEINNDKKLLLHYPLQSNKKGSNDLRKHLPEMVRSIDGVWNDSNQRILILCGTGNDLSVGLLLVLLSLYFDAEWNKITGSTLITKDTIKRHLAKVSGMKNNVNPSRATLQSINSFLMQ